MNNKKQHIFLLLLAQTCVLHSMETEKFSCSTYQGKEITPQSLLQLSPKMSQPLDKRTTECLNKYYAFINSLVTTPHPLNHVTRKEKTASNAAIIKKYEESSEVKNLSTFNYVLRFTEFPEFTMPINRWGSRMAYWIYASGQGSVLDPNFNENFDCSKFEYTPSYQHCSRVAHYLRLTEIMQKKQFKSLKTTPTYLKHIPHKPTELSDENYVVIQEWVPNLKELKEFPLEEQQKIRKNIPFAALQEIHEAIIYAALWDLRHNLAIDGTTPYYYMVDLEEPFNHKPQFFYFQGTEGRKKYLADVIDGLERMAKSLLDIPEQFNNWKRLTKEHVPLNNFCTEFNIFPNYDADHLNKNQ